MTTVAPRDRCHRLALLARIPSWRGVHAAPPDEAEDKFAVPTYPLPSVPTFVPVPTLHQSLSAERRA
jgi:hypothetical protein